MRHLTFERELKRLGITELKGLEKEKTTARIFSESVRIVVLASVVSALGGVALEFVQGPLIAFLPFLILLPALNDMIGSFGAVASTKFTTMLYLKQVKTHEWMKSRRLHRLFMSIMTVAGISATVLALLAYGIAYIRGFPFHGLIFIQLIAVSLLATLLLTLILFAVSIIGGIYVYKRGHHPDNYLIPLTTAIGDLGGMLTIAGVLFWLL